MNSDLARTHRNSRLEWLGPGMAFILIAWGCLCSMSNTAYAAPEWDPGFRPSVEGKKLLHYRPPGYDYMLNHTDEMEKIAFDGLIIGGFRPFYMNEKEFDFDAWAEKMKKVPFKRYTDNFYLCYSGVDAIDKPDFDWFHDFSWVVENWKKMAKAAKDAGFKGICFDSEHYGGKPLFGYEEQKYAGTKSFAEYQAQAKKRGAEIMRGVSEVYPDITIIILFGYSGSFYGVPQHPKKNAESYNLVSAFVDGMLSECGPGATIHDMHEQSFSLRVPGSYERSRKLLKEVIAEQSTEPDAYREHHKAGFSFWADCWGNNGAGRAFDVNDFETNYYTPLEMAYSIHWALAYSDKYVWMWPGAINWWQRTVTTVGDDRKEVTVPLPEEYAGVLELAHQPTVPEPPRDRKPNTWRIESASQWKGWKDEEAFGDLWNKYKFIADLPLEWKFTLDPDEEGLEKGYEKPGYDDSAWRKIKIREFWEPQGFSPYDGQAWYRVTFKSPEAPKDPGGLFLAFGAVADEATVYVNGSKVYASVPGDNIRHKRFLADVTDVWKPGAENQVTVRVWNVSWCGGIWKNVKLVAKK